MELLSINYPNGYMKIDMDFFFPADPARLRKLFRVVDMADDCGELRRQAADFCRARAAELSEERPSYARAAVNCHTRATELQNDIDRQQARLDRLERYRVPKETLKRERGALRELKGRQRMLMADFRSYRHRFESAGKKVEKLKKNVEVIES